MEAHVCTADFTVVYSDVFLMCLWFRYPPRAHSYTYPHPAMYTLDIIAPPTHSGIGSQMVCV